MSALKWQPAPLILPSSVCACHKTSNLSKQAIPPLLPCSDIPVAFMGKEQVLIDNNTLIICSFEFISKWKTSVKTYAAVSDRLASNQNQTKLQCRCCLINIIGVQT